jgi:hypothetical protein
LNGLISASQDVLQNDAVAELHKSIPRGGRILAQRLYAVIFQPEIAFLKLMASSKKPPMREECDVTLEPHDFCVQSKGQDNRQTHAVSR